MSETPTSEVRMTEPGGTCELCYGTGLEIVPGKGARRCGCQKPATGRLFSQAQVPPRHERCTFQNYKPEPGNGSQLKAFNYAFRLARDYPAVERGLLLAGPCGVGKTHLSVAILRALTEKGVPCLFRDFGSLLKEIQATYDPQSSESESRLLASVCNAEVLLLDELGAAKMSEWARDVLGQVIGTRYNFRRLTLVTTNYRDERLAAADETLEDRIGARLRSRLKEMCKTVVVEGTDYRDRIDRADF